MPDTRFHSDEAQLVAVFVECIFYGIYLVTFVASLQSILVNGPQPTWFSRLRRNKTMFTVVLLMFVVSTLNLALGLVRILQGFIYNRRTGPGGAIEQLGLDWVNIVKPLTVNLQTMLADGVLIYRCWILYAKSRKVVMLPVFLWFGALACTAVSMYMQGILTSGSRVNGGTLFPVIISFWSATIVLNLYATMMIVIRIWRVVNKTAVTPGVSAFCPMRSQSRLQNIKRIIVESGLIYTTSTVTVFTTLLSGSNSIFITTAVEIQVIGIAFNLILIRAKAAKESATENWDYTEHDIQFVSPTNTHGTGQRTAPQFKASSSEEIDVEKAANDAVKSRDIGTRHTF